MNKLLPLAITLALVSSACSIKQEVVPIPDGTTIGTLYVQKNEDLHMKEFHSTLVSQIEQTGTNVITCGDSWPADATYRMSYTANWSWDMAMYLAFFHADVFEGDQIIGSAEYNAKGGGANMSKFGATENKIRPLILELFRGEAVE